MKKLAIGTIGDSGCPCGTFRGKGFVIEAHCWRTGGCCPFSGVHVSSPEEREQVARKKAEDIKEYIEEAWGTDVAIKHDFPPKTKKKS